VEVVAATLPVGPEHCDGHGARAHRPRDYRDRIGDLIWARIAHLDAAQVDALHRAKVSRE
jgi:hypothetical protein